MVRLKEMNEGTKLALTALVSVVVTGGVAWFGFGARAVTKEDVREAVILAMTDEHVLNSIPFPWKSDRAVVMAHVNSVGPGTIHENDTAKRARIYDVIEPHLALLGEKIDHLSDSVKRVENKLDGGSS